MDNKVKIIIALLGVLVVIVVFALTPLSGGLMGYLQFSPVVSDGEVTVEEGEMESSVTGIVSARADLLDDSFYIDRYGASFGVRESTYEPYDLPGVAELVERNFEPVFGAQDLSVERVFKVAFVHVDIDFDGQLYVFSQEERDVLESLKEALPGVFGYAAGGQLGLDSSFEVTKVFVPQELEFDVMYDWVAGDTAANLSKVFYESNADEFDFVFFFGKHISGMSRFVPVSEMSKGKGCRNSYGYEVFGDSKCLECFDYAADFGSEGRLKGVIMMSTGGDILNRSSTCELGMLAGADASMMRDVHNVYNDFAVCDEAFAWLDGEIEAPYWVLTLLLHELEHYWGVNLFPYDEELFASGMEDFPVVIKVMLQQFENFAYRGHFRYAVEGVESVDPLGAVAYEWTDEGAKVCLQYLYPYRPLKFHPVVMHMMGVSEGIDVNREFKAINGGMEFVKWEKDCVYLKPGAESRISDVSVQDIVYFWGESEMCE